MVEQQRLGFLGWFFRAFAAALGTVVGLLCGVAILGAGAWIWQERMGGEVDLEMTAPVIETDLDLAIETDSEFDFGYESPEADSLMTPDGSEPDPITPESESAAPETENKRVVANPEQTRR